MTDSLTEQDSIEPKLEEVTVETDSNGSESDESSMTSETTTESEIDPAIQEELQEEIREEQLQQDKELWKVMKHKEAQKVFQQYLKNSRLSPDMVSQLSNALELYKAIKKLKKAKVFSSKKAQKIQTNFLSEKAPLKVDIKIEINQTKSPKQMYNDALYSVIDLLHLRLSHFMSSYEYRNYQNKKAQKAPIKSKLKGLFKL